MKRAALFSVLSVISGSLLAQPAKTASKTPAKPPVKTTATAKPAVVKPALKSLNDSASYSIGLAIANSYKREGVSSLNTALVSRGCSDVLQNKPVLLNEFSANETLNRFMTQVQQSKTKPVTPAAKPAVKPTTVSGPLKTLRDSASYSIGIRYGNFYKQYGVTMLNAGLITNACNDVLENKPTQLNESHINKVLNDFIIGIQLKKSQETIDAGNTFLAENKKRAGVTTTASGLQYEVVTEGTGIKPTAADSVTCHYRGTYISGTEFDASYNHGGPITFSLGGVIRGWTEGLQLMTTGSKYKLFVPYDLAYGAFDYNGIPGGSALIFEIELLDVKKRQ
ncbi:MAG: FKBP-type peptidyl-prolyl cis-trans isomerase [Chitinophagaceae bacterium]|nr:FKBP-type peptidyl-prolyl cis-trans isomerase [Chitinophagaceae bacterium]